ncbi:hypothetical protein HIM_03389 [Hirsutella minnesotensis 3608]|uniref:Enterotoxin n=1 Tax=Hirsutella minnesotensis 3608 TaxID=1043627 RepID=A0A0F7ZVR4_9HYPO|nr:hypothetical protein HIM_03389 [Hirsutella minnesotensis 3608]
MRSWISCLLWALALMLFEPTYAVSLPEFFRGRVSKSEPFVTYRGDGRHPDIIRGSTTQPSGFLTREPPRHYDGAYSLTNHLTGWDDFKAAGVPENFDTRYVSTSKDLDVARRFAKTKADGYIYMIKTTPNAIDVVQSIKDSKISENEKKELLRYEGEAEFAFLEGISWRQVKAWAKADSQVWTKNPDYDERFDQFTHGGAQPQLVDKSNIDLKEDATKFLSSEGNRKAKDVGTAPSFCGIDKVKRDCTPQFGAKDDPVYESKWGVTGKQTIKGSSTETMPVDELQQMGDGIAESHFSRLGDKLGLKKLDKKLSLHDMRSRFKEFKLPSAESKVGSGMLLGGLGLYVKDVIDAFSSRMSFWDRAAVLTSIIPIIGCDVQAIAAEQRDQLDVTDLALCTVGDGLMVSAGGLVPGLAVHLSRMIRDHFTSKGEPSDADVQRQRDEQWQAHVAKMDSHLVQSVAEAHFKAEMAGPLFEATQAWGKLKAGEQGAAKAGKGSQADIEANFQVALKHVRDKFSAEVSQRKERLAKDLPAIVQNSLNAHAVDFNKHFTAAFEGVANEHKTGKGKIDAVVQQLQNNPLRIPDASRINSLISSSLEGLVVPSLCGDKPDESIHNSCLVEQTPASPKEKPKPVEKHWWEGIQWYPKTTMSRD